MNNVLTGKVVITAPGVQQTFDGIAAATRKGGRSLQTLSNSSNQATLSLTNLSRVAQDAPYGFIGIANNLNPLLESFQRLKASTGSTGSAFKALGKSLTGAGGIGLAIGVVSSLLVVFGDKLFGASKASKAAKEENEKLGQSLAEQAVKLASLVGIVQNIAATYDNKKKTLQAINQEYKSYLSNLGIEEVTALNIASAYDKIVDSMIRQAVIKGLQNEITKAVEETAAKIIVLEKAEEQRRLASEKANNQTKVAITSQQRVTKELDRFNAVRSDGVIAQQQMNEEQVAGLGALNNYDAALKRVKAQLMASLEPVLNLTKNFGDLGITLDKTKPVKTGEIKIEPSKIKIGAIKDFDFDALRVTNFLKGKFKIPYTLVPEGIDSGGGTQVGDLSDAEKALIKAGEELGAAFNTAFQTAIQDSFAALGEGLGNILSGKDFGNEIFSVIGSFLEKIGKALIAVGTAGIVINQVLKNALAFFAANPVLAVAAGVAAIAAGTVLKNAISGARALGGPVSAGGTYLVGERGPELFRPNTGGDIIPNNQLGGRVSGVGMMVTVGGQFALRGQDLVAAITLANQSTSRLQ